MRYPMAFFSFLISSCIHAQSPVQITINAVGSTTPISPYIYGRNNSLSDDPSKPLSSAAWTQLRDAGVTFFRESGGNNCTKYNWKRKLSSHPDWYNNVYAHDWDFAAKSLQQNIPSVQGMWAFQLIGKSAMTVSSNFADYTFNQSAWWQGVNQNLAGGGTPNPGTWTAVSNPATASTKAAKEGNTQLYLQDWTADSTVLILNHWFSQQGLDKNHLKYWNMDNEVEIWSGTHDDLMPSQLAPEAFMQLYFAVAKKARESFPAIKIVGPVTANEWQWYNWNNNIITVNGANYPWLEFFIKHIAEEEQATGIRLLDVLDIHFYPSSSATADVVQMHRVYFDTTYVFPEANGVKKINGVYDNSQTKEYILERCSRWLTKYLGSNHGVTLGVTETGVNITDPNALAVWYASTMGEFMKHPQMEIFTPWTWKTGMWEALHLFSRYNEPLFIPASSSNDTMVSAYPSINASSDSLTIVLVNRSTTGTQSVNLNLQNFALDSRSFTLLKLSNLPSSETFASHQANALQHTTISATGNTISLSMPALSVFSLQLTGHVGQITAVAKIDSDDVLQVFPNPAEGKINLVVNASGNATAELIDATGKTVKELYKGIITTRFSQNVDISSLAKGIYFIRLSLDGKVITRKVVTY